LQPFRYPDDVEPFIAAWFGGRQEQAAGIAAQLRNRPGLQKAATVPLVLAFYCILGDDQPLPAHRVGLYTNVIRRMLTGRWRGSGDRDFDPDGCVEILRDWAWSAAASNPVSGIGAWADEFPTPRVKSREDRNALDHVAVPLGPPDPDTGMTIRRFVHRSIQEHLVAERVANTTAEQAADELLNHIWYDPDWEYAGPSALAMHPGRDEVLRNLICRAARSEQIPAEISVVDSCWQIREFLVKVSLESGEADWSIESAELISQARIDFAVTGRLGYVRGAVAGWRRSNSQVRNALLGLLARQNDWTKAGELAEAVVGLTVTTEERGQVREALLGLVGAAAYGGVVAIRLVETVARLAVTTEQRGQVRAVLLGLIGRKNWCDSWGAGKLAEAVAGLDPTREEWEQVWVILLERLLQETDSRQVTNLAEVAAGLAVTARERDQVRAVLLALVSQQTDSWPATKLAKVAAELDLTSKQRAQLRDALLMLLADESRPDVARQIAVAFATATASSVAETVAGLDPTTEEREEVRAVLLRLLALQTSGSEAARLAKPMASLAVTAEERRQVRKALLRLLAQETSSGMARSLASAAIKLDPTAEQQDQVWETLLNLLAKETSVWEAISLTKMMVGPNSTRKARNQVRDALLRLLAEKADRWPVGNLGEAMAKLAVTAEERDQTRTVLLDLLTRQANTWEASRLAEAIAGLEPTSEERAQARAVLLGLMTGQWRHRRAQELAMAMIRLAATAQERHQIREALVGLLAAESTWSDLARELAGVVAGLDPSEDDLAQARGALLRVLAWHGNVGEACKLAAAIARLNPTREEQEQARTALLDLLAQQTDTGDSSRLLGVQAAADLGATLNELGRRSLLDTASPRMLAALRSNSEISSWIAALPSLPSPMKV
jgi:hypothetical protein